MTDDQTTPEAVRWEFLGCLRLASALEPLVARGAGPGEMFNALAQACHPAMWPELGGPEEQLRAEAHQHLLRRRRDAAPAQPPPPSPGTDTQPPGGDSPWPGCYL